MNITKRIAAILLSLVMAASAASIVLADETSSEAEETSSAASEVDDTLDEESEGEAAAEESAESSEAEESTTESSEEEVETEPTLDTPEITVEGVTTKSVKISWEPVEGATEYRVYRATKKKGTYKEIKTITDPEKLSFTNKKLKADKIYYYKVKAFNGEEHSDFSEVVMGMGVATIENLVVWDYNETLTLSWDVLDGVDGYIVYKQTEDGEEEQIYTFDNNSSNAYTDFYVWTNGTFTYSVRSYVTNDKGTFLSKAVSTEPTTVWTAAATPVPTAAPTPVPSSTSLRDTASQYVGQSVSALYSAIGYPASSEYQAGCTTEGDDYEEGFLYYDGFTVMTISKRQTQGTCKKRRKDEIIP